MQYRGPHVDITNTRRACVWPCRLLHPVLLDLPLAERTDPLNP